MLLFDRGSKRTTMLTREASGTERAEGERPNRCDRCGGLLVREGFEEGAGLAEGWRCVICGERLDAIILKNRRERSDRRGRGRDPDRSLALAA